MIVLGWTCWVTGPSCACCPRPDVYISPWRFWVVLGYEYALGADERNDVCLSSWSWYADDGHMRYLVDYDGCGGGTGYSDRGFWFDSVNIYQPTAYAYSSCGSDSDWAQFYAVDISLTPYPPYPYIQANDDDDDENGWMDHDNHGALPSADDDLVRLDLYAASPSRDTTQLVITGDNTALRVWKNPTRTNLLIDSPDLMEQWTTTVNTTVYVEAKRYSVGQPYADPYLEWNLFGLGLIGNPLQGWNGTPAGATRWTAVRVDMDLEGVADDPTGGGDTHTEETTPGGFIPAGEFVQLTVKPVQPDQPEIPDWGAMTLSVEGATNKIEIWNTNKTALVNLSEPLTPPLGGTILWVKGVQASSSLRDITLVLTHDETGFQDRIRLTVSGIKSVDFEAYLDNDPPDSNPNAGGGKRMYPDKKSYGDTYPDRRKQVRVVATLIGAALDNQHVYFRSFDVDDPSNSSVIDTNGAVGNDNHAGSGTLSATDAVTDGSGEARVTFTVGMAPGDNYRVAASLNSNKLLDPYLTQAMADAGTPPTGVAFSPMLTVWRKLWVERDYMAPVAQTGPEKNNVTGTATSLTYDPATNTTTIDLGQNLPDMFDDENQFANGKYVTGGVTYQVRHSTAHEWPITDSVLVVGAPGPGAYTLYDDDDQNLLNSPFYCSVLAAPFAAAYIEIKYLPETYSQQVPFNLYMTDVDMTGDDYMSQKNVISSEGFWACLVVTGYQGEPSFDWDPSFEPMVDYGAHHHGETCVMFREVYRDCPSWSEAGWGAHEVGHTGGRAECSTNPCYLNGMSTSTPTCFCDQCIHFFRSHTTWSSSN
jgi:hypothetical protein